MSHRLDRDQRQRRERAQAHLARRRGRSQPSGRSTPSLRVAVGLGSLLAGFLFGDAFAARALGTGEVDVIAVRGTSRLGAQGVAEATGVARGAVLADVDADTVAEQLEDHDWIASARAVRLPGGALLVEVEERQPRAVVAAGAPNQLFVVDALGTPFARADETARAELTRLVPAASVTPREQSPRLAEAVRLAERLRAKGLARPVSLTVAALDDPEGTVLHLRGLRAAIVLGHDELDERIDALVRLLAHRAPEVVAAERVDLRFADQAVLRMGSTREGSDRAASRGRAASTPERAG